MLYWEMTRGEGKGKKTEKKDMIRDNVDIENPTKNYVEMAGKLTNKKINESKSLSFMENFKHLSAISFFPILSQKRRRIHRFFTSDAHPSMPPLVPTGISSFRCSNPFASAR